MPIVNVKEPGDNFYPDYARIVTLNTEIPVTKGHLYSVEVDSRTGTGNLVDFGTQSNGKRTSGITHNSVNVGFFRAGPFQAMQTIDQKQLDKNDGKLTVQCFAPGSRVGVNADQYVSIGGLVEWAFGNNGRVVLHPGTAQGNSALSAVFSILAIVGRVFEVYKPTEIGQRSVDTIPFATEAAAADNTVIIELGMR